MTTEFTEQEFEQFLVSVLEECEQQGSEQNCAELFTESFEGVEEPPRVETFEEGGVLTNNRGVVVRVGSCEFQLTIVRSR